MYLPESFRETDREALFALIERYDFATLITVSDDGPYASHVPFLLDRARGPHGTLTAHLARANPQWKHFRAETNVLVVFQGPHAYVSSSWYAPRPANVPTWNYAVVHARGPALLLPEGAPTLAVVAALTRRHEQRVGGTYVVPTDDDAVNKLARGIVAFEIPIAELSGKSKLSQNRTEADQTSVRQHLESSGDPLDRDVAAMMKRSADPR